MLGVSIIAAPISEEIAFRGYAMGLLRRQVGPISAMVICSRMVAAVALTMICSVLWYGAFRRLLRATEPALAPAAGLVEGLSAGAASHA